MEGSLPKQQSFITVDLLSQIFEEKFLQELPGWTELLNISRDMIFKREDTGVR